MDAFAAPFKKLYNTFMLLNPFVVSVSRPLLCGRIECFVSCVFLRDTSNESGATDAVALSMSIGEIEDPEVKGKKKRGRPGKQAPVRVGVSGVCVNKGLSVCVRAF